MQPQVNQTREDLAEIYDLADQRLYELQHGRPFWYASPATLKLILIRCLAKSYSRGT